MRSIYTVGALISEIALSMQLYKSCQLITDLCDKETDLWEHKGTVSVKTNLGVRGTVLLTHGFSDGRDPSFFCPE